MRKKIIPLALMAVTGTASAQSSVTLYGVVDTALSYYQASDIFRPNPYYLSTYGASAVAGYANQSIPKGWTMSGGNNVPTLLGFKGKEDLGGGYSVGFWLESGISSSTGALLDTSFFGRGATVSVSGPFGKIEAGRNYTPMFWSDYFADPFGAVGTASNLIFKAAFTGQYYSPSFGTNYIWHDNTFTYTLPPNLGGVYGEAQFAPDENPNYSSAVRNGKEWGVRLGWRGMGADLAAAYGQTFIVDDNGTTAGQKGKVTTLNLMGIYDFKVAKVTAEASQFKYLSNDVLAHNFHGEGFILGLVVPAGKGRLLASYAHLRLNGLFSDASAKPKADMFALGFVYNLSKRTAIYTTGAYLRDRGGATSTADSNLGWSSGALPTGNIYDTGGTLMGAYNLDHSYGFDLGIRHEF